jgi:hypothetical protein
VPQPIETRYPRLVALAGTIAMVAGLFSITIGFGGLVAVIESRKSLIALLVKMFLFASIFGLLLSSALLKKSVHETCQNRPWPQGRWAPSRLRKRSVPIVWLNFG